MSGAQTSSFYPVNQLLVDNAQQIQNTYAPQRNELFVQRARQEIGGTQIEHVSRAAAAVDALPLDQQPAAWQAGGEALVRAGVIPSFQPYPGPERVKQLAGMGMSVENQFKLRGAQNTPDIYGVGGTQPGASGSTAGAVPALPIPARGTGGPGASAAMPPEYMDHFRRASAETGIPVDLLIAQARQESSFNPNARGAAGEIGIFQIKPSTAQQPGFGLTGVDPGTLTDPGANIMFGARYLKARMGQGDPNNPADQARALAAYNGGGDPNYVANVNRYRPGQSPTDPTRAITTYTPGAPPAPGTPPPYQVATTGAVPPPPGAAPGAVAPVAAPGAPSVPGAPPVAPVAAPAATPAPPAAMPPELQTDATRLTPQDKRELAPILARVRAGQVPYETYQNEVQQRQAANVARQDKWQAQQVAAQQHAQTTADAAARLELSRKADARAEAEAAQKAKDAGETYVPGTGIEAVHENTVQKYAAKMAKGQQLTDDEQRLYDGAYYALQQHGGQALTVTDPDRPGVMQGVVIPRRLPPSWPEPKGGRLPDIIRTPGATTKAPEMNEGQGKAAGFADRIQANLPIITDTSPAAMNRWQQLLGQAPIVGNSLVTEEFQQHMQAERDFINAVLRRESGASIQPSEFESARKQYIPQPGDGPKVLEQKARNRETVLNGMIREAGPGYKPATSSAAPPATPTTPSRVIRYDHTGKRIEE